MARNISYGGNSLQTANITVSNIDEGSLPSRKVNIYELDHADASKVPSFSWPSKTITVTGSLRSTSVAAMDSLQDTFKSYLDGREKSLDIDYAGSTRRYIATVTGMPLVRPYGLTYADFTITFICSSPYGRDISSTSLASFTARTLGTYSDTLVFGGTARYQRPIITVTYTALTVTNPSTVILSNDGNGQLIMVTRAWTSGDILQVDSFNRTVTVNGSIVDFTGSFIEFVPGSNVLTYSDNFTSRTFNETVTYTAEYL